MIKHQVYHCFPEHDVEWSITSEHAATSACTHALYGRTPDETTPVQWLALQTDRRTAGGVRSTCVARNSSIAVRLTFTSVLWRRTYRPCNYRQTGGESASVCDISTMWGPSALSAWHADVGGPGGLPRNFLSAPRTSRQVSADADGPARRPTAHRVVYTKPDAIQCDRRLFIALGNGRRAVAKFLQSRFSMAVPEGNTLTFRHILHCVIREFGYRSREADMQKRSWSAHSFQHNSNLWQTDRQTANTALLQQRVGENRHEMWHDEGHHSQWRPKRHGPRRLLVPRPSDIPRVPDGNTHRNSDVVGMWTAHRAKRAPLSKSSKRVRPSATCVS